VSAQTDRANSAQPGRPRDPQIDAAILGAALDALDDVGYAGLTLEDVARRAGTTKPALYRRWREDQRR
jgi:AcrR family transcriptional regulator